MIRVVLLALAILPISLLAQNDTQAPQLITLPVSGITATSAVSGGDILSDGGNFIFNRGIVWDIDTGATILNHLGLYQDGQGIGQYSGVMGSLTPNTQYFVRAFAQDLNGDFYGSHISFMTATASINESTDIWMIIGPNPTSDFIQFTWKKEKEIRSISLYDVSGKRILDQDAVGITELKWDLSGLTAGTYIVRWENREGYGTSRIIKR